MPRFENPSVAGPDFRDKCKRGRPKRKRGRSKRERGRYVSEAAPHFGNLCVYEPSALRKKPSGLRQSRAANAFRKGVPNRGINFKDAYRNCPIADNYLFTEETTTHSKVLYSPYYLKCLLRSPGFSLRYSQVATGQHSW